MLETKEVKPYHVQLQLSDNAKQALKREKGRLLAEGSELSLAALARAIIEKWAEDAG